jgi:tetraprenyl-beta-curcumene synthase
VDKELNKLTGICDKAESEMLRELALSSIEHKRFHALGGSVFSLYPNVEKTSAVKFIVSLQSISDYLDNLCDRAGITDEVSFSRLHLSVTDAVNPFTQRGNYYEAYPEKKDNGYLDFMVDECRKYIESLPSYYLIADSVIRYAELYSELQVNKHLSLETREPKLKDWALSHIKEYPDIFWWEFSAASGSTLGIFALIACASNPQIPASDIKAINNVYFPWISGLHILLDYYIDAIEDTQMGDLNFTFFYDNLKQCEERMLYFIQQSLKGCLELPYPKFHLTVVRGLLAMYLSDPKADTALNKLTSSTLIKSGGRTASFYSSLCRLLRHIEKL